MNVHTRGLLVLVTLLVGCGIQQRHSLEWPGVRARAYTYFGGDPKYHRIGLVFLDDGPPVFSVRFPGGRIITPDEFTIAKLESHGAKDGKSRTSGGSRSPAGARFTYRRIESGAGTLYASFDEQNRLQNISIIGHIGEGTVFVGDRSGRRMIALPASRDQLVKLFGEPKRESSATL